MPAKKKTTKRKASTKALSPAQLRARKAFAAAAKARSKASKKKAAKRPNRRNATIIKAKRIEHLDVSKVHNPGLPKLGLRDAGWVAVRKSDGQAVAEFSKGSKAVYKVDLTKFKLVPTQKYLAGLNKKNPGKSTRRKYRNGYLDLVIMGHAKKTPSGWSLGGKTFKQGKGIVPASKRGYYLDRATGTVFSKKARNAEHRDADHPIEVTKHYRSGPPGYMTPWQRAHSQGQQGLFDHGIKPAKKRNPRYFAYGIDANGREHDLAVRVAQNKTQTLAWVKKNHPGYKKYVVELSEKFDYIGPKGGIKIKRPKRVSGSRRQRNGFDTPCGYCGGPDGVFRGPGHSIHCERYVKPKRRIKTISARKSKKLNPSVKSIRKEFAGTLGKASDVFAPIGTPRNVAKLGRLKFIGTESATIKPTGIVYLCADSKGKLHLCGSKNVPIYSGAAQSFGEVEKVEYETAKPHLYPGEGIIWFTHKMGENGGKRPTLYADGKGGLKFRGGSYKITREGIVD